VEELQDEQVVADLRQRADGRMPEGGVGVPCHCGEVGGGDVAVDVGTDDGLRRFRIGAACQRGDGIRLHARPGLRQIETAIAGETREEGVRETEHRGLSPGGHVLHDDQVLLV
jgi:hypothetical protein